MIYLDSSALVKLIVPESESAALAKWLGERPNLVRVSSSIVRTEVPRAVCRQDPRVLPECYQIIRRVREVRLTDSVLARAGVLKPVAVRAIDAIHLASALAIRGDLSTFVAYDQHLLAAAKDAGLLTASPA